MAAMYFWGTASGPTCAGQGQQKVFQGFQGFAPSAALLDLQSGGPKGISIAMSTGPMAAMYFWGTASGPTCVWGRQWTG